MIDTPLSEIGLPHRIFLSAVLRVPRPKLSELIDQLSAKYGNHTSIQDALLSEVIEPDGLKATIQLLLGSGLPTLADRTSSFLSDLRGTIESLLGEGAYGYVVDFVRSYSGDNSTVADLLTAIASDDDMVQVISTWASARLSASDRVFVCDHCGLASTVVSKSQPICRHCG